jgi:methionyl-tRNA formyltransferase
MTLRILIAGQKYFGAAVLDALRALPGVEVAAVAAPDNDRLARRAGVLGVPVIRGGTLSAETMPGGVDLIVAAHSHDFIGERTRLRARWGGVGYHPSLLPLHRGRDAVRWAVRMRERVTGGSVYRLSNRMDGGDILAQQHVLIRPDDTAEELWRRDLAPLGVALLVSVVRRYAEGGYVHGAAQDEALATWEPSIDRPPAFRPDLLMIEGPRR